MLLSYYIFLIFAVIACYNCEFYSRSQVTLVFLHIIHTYYDYMRARALTRSSICVCVCRGRGSGEKRTGLEGG